jgi:hypothetical protein
VQDIPGEEIIVRLNKSDGKADTFRLPKMPLIGFADKAIDVALLPVDIDPTVYDFMNLPFDRLTWEKEIDALGSPHQGDEVSIVGLYTSHFGYESNVTIVRIGHIGALPGEKVMTDQGYVRGYLIGTHSIAGHSGSPVLLNYPTVRVKDNHLQYSLGHPHLPLGVLIGHHVVETREDEIFVPQFQIPENERQSMGRPPSRNEERRTGFAVVISWDVLFDLFEGDEMKELLDRSIAQHRKGFKRDSSRPAVVRPSDDEANPEHLGDFKRLVDAAARKRPQGGQT